MTDGVDARIPLIIGVTENGSPAEPDLPSNRRRVEIFFDKRSARCPHTPLRVLSEKSRCDGATGRRGERRPPYCLARAFNSVA